MSKKGRIIAAVVALVVVGAIAAFAVLRSQGGGPQIETATVNQQELAVTVTASGKVEAGVQVDVYPPTQGTLDEVYVSDGETVTAGTKLAAMDTEPLELQVAQAQAALSQAQAQLAAIDDQASGPADITAARANVEATRKAYQAAQAQAAAVGDQAPSAAQIDAAEAGTDAAKAAYDNAKAVWKAYPSDDATKAVLAANKDQANAAYLSAKAAEGQLKSTDLSAACAQANAAVSQAYAAWKGAEAQLAKLQGASTSEQKEAARAAVDQAALALRLAEDNLDDAVLKAPIDGVVIFNDQAAAAAAAAAGAGGGGASTGGKLDEGSAVSPAAAPFSVVDLDALKFTAEVDEADINRVKVGMDVDITLDAFPGETFATQVTRLNPVAQATATGGTIFEVEMVVEDTGQDILIGMKGDATIKVSSQANALTVPVEALFSEGGTDYVYVVVNNTLNKTEITVGATTDTDVEVLSGLEEGQTVALSGSTQYTDGMSVRVE
ncbi:MAG TPA: efflux RND transporter periplasmic adaptor subunit [Coriobacteriia bacterium]|nr:efflux RND transporter periplasmic adaptor subunit [Coriobacteriia bacterium]